MAVLLGLTEGILGATIATFFCSHFRQAALSKKIVVASLFILALMGNVYFLWLFAHEGSMEKLICLEATRETPCPRSWPRRIRLPPDRSTSRSFSTASAMTFAAPNTVRTSQSKHAPSTHRDFFKDFERLEALVAQKILGLRYR